MAENTSQNKNYLPIALLAIALVVVVSLGIFLFKGKTTTSTSEEVITEAPTTETGNNTFTYKDGVYSATGNYSTPSTKEEIDVTLTLKDGIITEAEVIAKATFPTSKKMQTDFVANYKEQVVGKNIDEVNLVKVSGSSLTPKGFNEALEEIKAQAKS